MDTFDFVLYTILIIVFCNILGFFISIVSIHADFLQKYRIQKRKIKASTFYNRLPLILFNITSLILISSIGLYFMYPYFFEQDIYFDIGTVPVILIQLFIILIIDDLYFYFLHAWMHTNKYVLNKIHRVHHKSISPFALEYIYVHPLEWMMGMIGVAIAFVLILVVMPLNLYAFWIFGLLRNLHEIHIHSNVEMPFLSKIPFLSKTKHHDDHHAYLDGNYASTFVWMDRIFKTNFHKE